MRSLFLAAALILTACDSRPPPQPKTIDEITQIVRIAEKAIDVVQKIGAGASTDDVQGAVREMNVALDAARNQINGIMDEVSAGKYAGRGSIDPLNVSSCIEGHTINMYSIEEMSGATLPRWAMDVGQCAIFASTYFRTVPAHDEAAVALAISIVYPIAFVARVKAGFKAGVWLQNYRSVNEAPCRQTGAEVS